MNRPDPLRRRVLLSGVALLLLLSVTACNGIGSPRAATVEGQDVSTEKVLSLLEDRQMAADRQSTDGAKTNLVGPGKDTFTKRSFTDTLNQVVLAVIVNNELKRRHLTVKSSDRKAAKASLEQSAGASTIKDLPKELQTFVIDFAAAQSVLRKQVAKKGASKTAEARAQYDKIKATTPEQLNELCVTGAVFLTEASATTAQKRLDGGASLADATKGLDAQQVVDQEQCGVASGFPEEVQKLALGGVSAPISNQNAFIVLRLARRKTLSFDEVREQLEKNLPEPGAAELQAAIGKLVAKADVHVDPRYGRWNRQAGRVDPPPGTPTTLAPATTPTAPADGSGGDGGTPTTAPPTTQAGG